MVSAAFLQQGDNTMRKWTWAGALLSTITLTGSTFSALALSVAAISAFMAPVTAQAADDDGKKADKSDTASEASTDAADGNALIKEAHGLSKTAKTLEEFQDVVGLCNAAVKAGVTPANATYARQLLSWTHGRIGAMLAAEGKDDAALDSLSKSISLDNRRWRAYHDRGVSYGVLRNYRAALADFNKAIELYKNYPNAYFNRGEARVQLGNVEGALADFTEAVRLAPRDADAHNARGHALYRLGKVPEAIAAYGTAIKLKPTDATFVVNRGDASNQLGRYQDAANDYRAAIKLDPQFGRAYQSAAWLMATCPDARYRDGAKGVAAARKAIELDGEEDYRYLDTLAAALANSGAFEEAVLVAAKVVAMAPSEDADVYRARLKKYEAKKPHREGAAFRMVPGKPLNQQPSQNQPIRRPTRR